MVSSPTSAARTHDAVSVPTAHLDVNGVSFAYRRLGPESPEDQTPLVFLHRFRGTLDDWDPAFVDEVAAHRTVILFSDAAVGSSTGTPAKDVDEKARNAAAFIRGLGYDKADVLGFSMGGFVAQSIAILEPELIRKVVLVGTGPGGNPETDPHTDIVFQIALKRDYTFEDVRYLFFAEGREKETQASIDRINLRTDREPVVVPETIEAMGSLIMAFMGGDTGHYDLLGQLHQPVLIVSGDDDHFFPVKNQWLLYRQIPNAQLSVYPLAGHAPQHQHPVEVAAQVERFLSGS
jgi:pimeloyl-ACP methyl ester carboxylesterase